MYSLISHPIITARKEASASAPADPRNTESRDLLSAATQNVAIWVLSPSSARKTTQNVENKIFKSMVPSLDVLYV